jgi:MFS family permease
MPSAKRVLWLIAIAELLAMSLWFSGTAVLPQLTAEWHAGLGVTSWLTMAVQLGFVAGALLSAIFNLPDVFSATRIFVFSCFAAAICNAAFAAVAAHHIALALLFRFVTGLLLAGVYPTGMKILTGWYRNGRGLALGILVGALTVGSALPHAVHAFGGLPWRAVVLASSGFAVLAGVVVMFGVDDGPYAAPAPHFDFHQISQAVRNRRLRLANFGYLGHMWELYSMWGWITILLAASREAASPSALELASFAAIAAGAIGCVWAGWASDRAQHQPSAGRIRRRSRVTIWAMAVSGSCCVLAALALHHFAALVGIALVWGVAVVADSAQFSTIVSEVSDQRYVGTALTMQTALGFLLTTVSIRVIALIAARYGWSVAAAAMGIGPLLGIVAMLRLERAAAVSDPKGDRVVPSLARPKAGRARSG